MNVDWDTELTEEQANALLDQAAETIRKRKMVTPAILALEMHKPLANIGANAAVVFAPFLVPLLGYDRVQTYSKLLSRPHNIEKLLQRLESPDVPVHQEVSET